MVEVVEGEVEEVVADVCIVAVVSCCGVVVAVVVASCDLRVGMHRPEVHAAAAAAAVAVSAA